MVEVTYFFTPRQITATKELTYFVCLHGTLFLAEKGQWTNQPSKARGYRTLARAVKVARKLQAEHGAGEVAVHMSTSLPKSDGKPFRT